MGNLNLPSLPEIIACATIFRIKKTACRVLERVLFDFTCAFCTNRTQSVTFLVKEPKSALILFLFMLLFTYYYIFFKIAFFVKTQVIFDKLQAAKTPLQSIPQRRFQSNYYM